MQVVVAVVVAVVVVIRKYKNRSNGKEVKSLHSRKCLCHKIFPNSIRLCGLFSSSPRTGTHSIEHRWSTDFHKRLKRSAFEAIFGTDERGPI